MMYIEVDPVAFAIGSFSMRWYGVMVPLAIAFLVGWVLYFGKMAGLTMEFVVGAALWGIPLGQGRN